MKELMILTVKKSPPEEVAGLICDMHEQNTKLRKELENIANALPANWDDPEEFTPWAQNRARHALNSLPNNLL